MSTRIEGLNELKIDIRDFAQDVINEIGKTLVECGELIEERAKRLTPQGVSNKLRNSNFSDARNPLKVEVTNNNFYAPFVEFGTKRYFDANGRDSVAAEFKGRGKGEPFEKLVQNMFEYLEKKKYWPAKVRTEAQKLGYAKWVAGKIAKNGIKPQPFFYRAFDELRPDIERKIKEVLK